MTTTIGVEVGQAAYLVGAGARVELVETDAESFVYVQELDGRIRLLTERGELTVTPELARLAREHYFTSD